MWGMSAGVYQLYKNSARIYKTLLLRGHGEEYLLSILNPSMKHELLLIMYTYYYYFEKLKIFETNILPDAMLIYSPLGSAGSKKQSET